MPKAGNVTRVSLRHRVLRAGFAFHGRPACAHVFTPELYSWSVAGRNAHILSTYAGEDRPLCYTVEELRAISERFEELDVVSVQVDRALKTFDTEIGAVFEIDREDELPTEPLD